MTKQLGWGILGSGGIARLFAGDLVTSGLTIAAVGSRSQATADSFAGEFGIHRSHASYEALVEDPSVDVVYVSTPHTFHAQNAKLALQAGKHVLVEKPFALNAVEAREVVELAEQRGLVVLEAMWTRWLPHMLRIRELIAAGALGEVRTVIADHGQKLSDDPTHRLNAPELGGGALLDLGIYPISFAWDVLRAPSTVSAISTPTATGVDRQTAIVLGYAGGQQALLHTALDARGQNEAAIIGTRGRIAIDSTWYVPTGFTLFDEHDVQVERFEQSVPGRGMQFQAMELERLVAAGETVGTILPPRETVAIMETMDEVRRQIGLRYPGEG